MQKINYMARVLPVLMIAMFAFIPMSTFAQYEGEFLGGMEELGGSIKDIGWQTDFYSQVNNPIQTDWTTDFYSTNNTPWTTDFYSTNGTPWTTDFYSGCSYNCYSVQDEFYPYRSQGCGSYCGSSYSNGCSYCGSSYPRSSGMSYIPYMPISVSSPRYPAPQYPASNPVNIVNTNTNVNNNVNTNTAIAIAYAAPAQPAPYCTINHALSHGHGVNAAYLSWNSTNAISAYLTGAGSVAINGSKTVWPGNTTTYTLTVYGQNGQQATCSTTVVLSTYVPSAPQNPYVALTQIPYTGFDGGLLGNSLYWIGLVLFAVAGAYVVVYYSGSVFSFAGMHTPKQYAPVIAPKAPILVEKEMKLSAPVTEEPIEKMAAQFRKAIGTTDTMAIVQGKGLMPRIVIDRSF